MKKVLNVISTTSPEILFLDKHGTTAVLWSDSHTPLARHIATYNIHELKRYCINQIYKTGSIGSPPEPTTELAFDIVTQMTTQTQTSRDADAEVIVTFSKILQDCQLPVMLLVSHHLLIKAVFVYCGVPDDQQSMACHQLRAEFQRMETNRCQFNPANLTFACNNQPLDQLLALISARGDLQDVKSYLTKRPGWEGDAAFTELEEIISEAEGLQCPIFISMNTCLELYDSHSGFVFRFTCQNQQEMYVFNLIYDIHLKHIDRA